MTNQKINQRIAEACGWTSVKEDFECILGRPPNTSDLYCRVPNYAGCLNAIHEAEKVLTDDQYEEYNEYLEIVVGITWSSSHSHHMRSLISATARQKAEAFLKTFGKWEEEA